MQSNVSAFFAVFPIASVESDPDEMALNLVFFCRILVRRYPCILILYCFFFVLHLCDFYDLSVFVLFFDILYCYLVIYVLLAHARIELRESIVADVECVVVLIVADTEADAAPLLLILFLTVSRRLGPVPGEKVNNFCLVSTVVRHQVREFTPEPALVFDLWISTVVLPEAWCIRKLIG